MSNERTATLGVPADAEILRRKDEHLDLALGQQAQKRRSGFDDYQLEHCALPEVDLDEIDLSVEWWGRRLPLPFVISSMTGGPVRGARINAHLAEAAETLGLVLAVGSQRVAIEGAGEAGLGRELRRLAPTAPIWSNLGAAQLVAGYGVDEARRAVDMIEADALIIHLNPLQEAVQAGGDRRWKGVLGAMETLIRQLERPVVVKEVGYGLSAEVGRALAGVGVAALDVAGSGGTAWADIEGARSASAVDRKVADAFQGWGLETPAAVEKLRAALPDMPLIASGGVRHGVDAAVALRLGADLIGQAGPVLRAALESPEAVLRHFDILKRQLHIACFCTGSRDLLELRGANLSRRS